MKKIQFIIILICLGLISCEDNATNSQEDSKTITGNPISFSYCYNSDSLYSSVDTIITFDSEYLAEINILTNYLTTDDSWNEMNIHYYSVAVNDTLIIDINKARPDVEWKHYIDDSNIGEIVKIEELRRYDTNYADYRIYFLVSKETTGYVQLFQLDPSAYGITLCLSVNPIQEIELSIDEIYFHSTINGESSDGYIQIIGHTNVPRLRSESYGDGCISSFDIELDGEGNFDANIGGSFQVDYENFIFPGDCRIALYGGVGFPKVIEVNQ